MAFAASVQRKEALTAKERRIEKLTAYPVNSMIVWKFGGGNPEEVIRHDTKLGRLITRGKGNYDPFEVDAFVEK